MAIKVAINGYGRIGRNVLRALYESGRTSEVQVVAINDLGDAKILGHLTRYDTAHGKFPGTVEVADGAIVVNGDRIRVTSERDPSKLPWGELGVDVVLECTGLFTSKDKAGQHLKGGAKQVLISAPGCEPTFLTGIRPDREPLKVELRPGDGRKLTMDDVKSAQSASKAAGGGGQQKQISEAEAKKQQAEYEKKRKEIDDQNKKLQADFENMKKFFESGLAKMNAKDYAGAAADLNEAAKVDAEQYAIWANLALALFNKGVTDFNESTKDPARRDPAKQAFTDAIGAAQKARVRVASEFIAVDAAVRLRDQTATLTMLFHLDSNARARLVRRQLGTAP